MKLLFAPILFTTLTPLVAQARDGAPPNVVLHWNRVVAEALAAAKTDPLTESRVFAIVQLAVHGALAVVDADSGTGPGTADSSAAAVAAAASAAASGLLPGLGSKLDEELERSLQAIAAGAPRSRGIEAGRSAAAASLAARAGDGSDRAVEVPAGTRPGQYRPTPPDLTPAWMAHWGSVTPFSLRSSDQFRPPPPPAVDSALGKRDVEQVRCIGGRQGSMRDEEHSLIARFWYENSPQGWNRIACTVAQSRQLDARESARLLALVNLALADGYIASFEAKYHYAYWRPTTAIRAAGAPEWLSFLDTPPVPDYPSAHAVVGAAAATVLARFFANDFVAFETTSGQPFPGIERRFWSFSQAAQENAASRVLAGLHFPVAVNAGCRFGEDIGTWVFEHALAPVEGQHAAAAAHATRR
jgi:hypothetical protein